MAVPSSQRSRPAFTEAEQRRRQAQFRRRRIGALVAVLALIAVVVVAVEEVGGGSSHHAVTGTRSAIAVSTTVASSRSAPPAAVSTTATTAASATTASSTTTTIAATTLPTTAGPDPGTQPQTGAFPTASSAAFTSHMHALWNGIVADNVGLAMGGFFPQTAYLQVKSVADPAGDFATRLQAEYEADIEAAHHLLGANPAAAHFVGVQVQEGYAHWVQPGTCSNKIGYFEVPNARLIYAVGGQARSLGIASMISWRGEWYVVHLGAVNRTGTAGVVDDPEIGPGTSVNSATC